MDKPILRLCEWGTCDTKDTLDPEQRVAITEASCRWQEQNRLNTAPLVWEGTQGSTLRARQFVGVVEAGGCVVEVYPKLDSKTLAEESMNEQTGTTVLQSLLWMMQTANRHTAYPADATALHEERLNFADIWAWLLAKNLLPELRRGVIRQYITQHDDLHTVRGRILIGQQATRLFDRYDKVACEWQEFTADVPVNRVLRGACHLLQARVQSNITRKLLATCDSLLDEVELIDPQTAVQQVAHLPRFDRTMTRFERPFRLALRLLQGMGQNLQTGRADTWVFLEDMNKVWEGYVGALLRARFGDTVEEQVLIGYLLQGQGAGRIQQMADFRYRVGGKTVFIADAKYKHLAKGQDSPLTFGKLPESAEQMAAGTIITSDDVRQLTVYAEIDRLKSGGNDAGSLLLLYPYVGSQPLNFDTARTWNGSTLILVPVGVNQRAGVDNNLPNLPLGYTRP